DERPVEEPGELVVGDVEDGEEGEGAERLPGGGQAEAEVVPEGDPSPQPGEAQEEGDPDGRRGEGGDGEGAPEVASGKEAGKEGQDRPLSEPVDDERRQRQADRRRQEPPWRWRWGRGF